MSAVVKGDVDSVVEALVVEVVVEVAEVAEEVVVEVELRVVAVVEVDSIPSAVMVVSVDSVISVEPSLSVVNDGVSVSGRSVVVVSKGYTTVEESMYVTYPNTPRVRIVPRMRKIERHVGSILLGFALETCPSLTSFTG